MPRSAATRWVLAVALVRGVLGMHALMSPPAAPGSDGGMEMEMATMASSRSTNQAVIDLATKINGEQTEMDTTTSLLASFGKPTPADAGMGGWAARSRRGCPG